MADPFSGATSTGSAGGTSTAGTAPGSSPGAGTDTNWLSDISSALGLESAIQQGGGKGATQAATSAAKLGSNLGLFGSSSGAVGSLAADVTNLGNIIQGLQTGGVMGYGGAAVNTASLAARLGAQTGTMSAGTAAEIASVANPLADALSVYQFARNWQSGATGADALAGAQTGATIGTSILPGVGTLVGAGIGAAVGAVSSIFGPGKTDPENIGWDQYAAAYQKSGAAGVAGASPAQNYQMLAGIFDSRGSNIPFYNKYGRMGEAQFTTDMTHQINSALAQGTISPQDSAATIYSKVVQPWITSMGGSQGWQNTSTIQGAPEKQAVGNMLTSLIGQWQSGQLNSQSRVGISGQTIPGLQAFGAQGYNQQAAQQQQTQTQSVASQLATLLQSYPLSGGVTARM